jgi:hypothetical protein
LHGSRVVLNNGSIVSIDLHFNDLVLFVSGKFSSVFCLFDLDFDINGLSVEVTVDTVHVLQMIGFDVLGLFVCVEVMAVSKFL